MQKILHLFGHTNKTQGAARGFTLVETLVSLGIFAIVVVSASGVILSIISSNKKNQAVSSVVNNLNYTIESMVRDIKTGYKYQCSDSTDLKDFVLATYKTTPSSCTGSGPIDHITLISTITGKEQIVTYRIIGTPGDDAHISKTLYTEDPLNPSADPQAVTYPLTDQNNVIINSLEFTVNVPQPLVPPVVGATVGQPSVFLILTGTAKVNQIDISNFYIQTYISQRLPNFI